MKYSDEVERAIGEELFALQEVAQKPLLSMHAKPLNYADVARVVTEKLGLVPPLNLHDVRRRYAHLISGTPLRRNRKSVS